MPELESLRVLIARQFGVELPIEGGLGTRDAPIIVTPADLQDAADTQMQVLRYVSAARRVSWRMTSQEVVARERKLVRAMIETVGYPIREIVTQHEAIHFVLNALPVDGTATSLPVASGFVDSRSGIRLPSQMGWLHLGSATDNEPESPGLGWSVAYGAPTMKGTVYVYDRRERLESEDVDSERVVGEFEAAVGDVLGVNPGAEIKHQAVFREPSGRARCLLTILDLPGDSMSAVLLSAQAGCFVKACVTFDVTEREFGRMAHESMEAFVDAVRPVTLLTS